MTYLLGATIVFWALSGLAYHAAQHGEADDYGAVFPLLFCLSVSVVLSAVYVALVFWNHRFL